MKKYLILFSFFLLLSLSLSVVNFRKVEKVDRKMRSVYRKFGTLNNVPTKDCKIWQSLFQKYPVTEKKPIVVVIASYNNESICEKNLWSIFDQTYTNYRVIYIDDCSTDHTFERVQKFVKERGQEHRCTLIRNETRNLKLANVYRAYHSCRNDEIIVNVDGDDWLAHRRVLEMINQYYQNPDVWMTYGSSVIHPDYKDKVGKPIADAVLLSGQIRNLPFEISMLRTFYAGLFKQIQLKDFFYRGNFLANTEDRSYMFPMIEMAPKHVLFIPDVLYIINDDNPIRDHKVTNTLQDALAEHIAKKEPYHPLDSTFSPLNPPSTKIAPPDLILLSDNTPDLLEQSLHAYLEKFSPMGEVVVLFLSFDKESLQRYEQIKKTYPYMVFIEKTDDSIDPIGKYLLQSRRNPSPYVAIASDQFLLSHPIDSLSSMEELHKLGGVSFFLGHGESIHRSVKITEKMNAITIENLVKSPDLLNEPFLAIFNKEFLQKIFAQKGIFKDEFLKSLLTSSTLLEEISLLSNESLGIALHPSSPEIYTRHN